MITNTLLLLLAVSSTGFSTRLTVTPATLFNLPDYFSLQLPITDGDGITTIKQPKLKTYTDSTYFFMDDGDSEVVMFAPENGVLTDNGSGPRTELTEPREFFTFSGVHKMSYVTRVTRADHKVCIGQVKGDRYNYFKQVNNETKLSASLGESPLIVVEIIYDPDTSIVTSHFRDSSYNDVKLSLGKFALNDPIRIDIKVDGYKVYVSSQQVTLAAQSYSFWKNQAYKMHFKVGAYLQGTGTSSTRGGRVKLSQLQTSHT